MRVEMWRIAPERRPLADGRLSTTGVLVDPIVQGAGVEPGLYEVLFHVGEFFAESEGFLTVVPFRFSIKDVEEHFHLPLKFTRWGYSLFRGA